MLFEVLQIYAAGAVDAPPRFVVVVVSQRLIRPLAEICKEPPPRGGVGRHNLMSYYYGTQIIL